MGTPALLVNCSYFKQQSAAIMKLSTSSNLGVICTECVYLLSVYTVYVGVLIMEFLFIPTHSEPILNDHVLLLPENVHVSRSLLCMETCFKHGFIPVPVFILAEYVRMLSEWDSRSPLSVIYPREIRS